MDAVLEDYRCYKAAAEGRLDALRSEIDELKIADAAYRSRMTDKKERSLDDGGSWKDSNGGRDEAVVTAAANEVEAGAGVKSKVAVKSTGMNTEVSRFGWLANFDG